jgi:hypothetical protein
MPIRPPFGGRPDSRSIHHVNWPIDQKLMFHKLIRSA